MFTLTFVFTNTHGRRYNRWAEHLMVLALHGDDSAVADSSKADSSDADSTSTDASDADSANADLTSTDASEHANSTNADSDYADLEHADSSRSRNVNGVVVASVEAHRDVVSVKNVLVRAVRIKELPTLPTGA
jgi:uncharacterized protein YjbI with pentapeptide repeats